MSARLGSLSEEHKLMEAVGVDDDYDNEEEEDDDKAQPGRGLFLEMMMMVVENIRERENPRSSLQLFVDLNIGFTMKN